MTISFAAAIGVNSRFQLNGLDPEPQTISGQQEASHKILSQSEKYLYVK